MPNPTLHNSIISADNFWSQMIQNPQHFWTDLVVEWTDTVALATLLLWTIGKLASFNEKNKPLEEQKKFSLFLCQTATQVCILAALCSFLRLYFVKDIFFYNETARFGLLLTTVFILDNSSGFIEKHPLRPLTEYSFFIITALCFLLLLIEANDFIILFAGLLGFSLSLYILIMIFWTPPGSLAGDQVIKQGHHKKIIFFETFENAHEASLKYFYLSAFSSSLILLSSAIFYTMTQTVSFDELQLITAKPTTLSGFDWLLVWKKLFWMALALYTVGFAFKLSAFPSYFWAPEVYFGAASPITAFIILPVKLGVFTIFARTLVTTFEFLHDFWGPLLLFFGLGSLLVGALGALTERRFKKFLAYSSINQIGFILIALATGQIGGLQSAIFFFILYIFTTIALFAIFLNLQDRLTGRYIRYTTDLGFIWPLDWVSRLSLSAVFFSLAGLPPFGGFFSKFYVLLHLFQEGYWWTVLIGVFSSVVSAYYYLNLIALMWFGSVAKWTWDAVSNAEISGFASFQVRLQNTTKILLYAILFILLFFIFFNRFFLDYSKDTAYSVLFH